MTIESLIRARRAQKVAPAVVDFEDATAPVVVDAQNAQESCSDDVAAHEMQFDAAARPAAVSAQDDVVLPADWQLPPKAVKRRKGKGSK